MGLGSLALPILGAVAGSQREAINTTAGVNLSPESGLQGQAQAQLANDLQIQRHNVDIGPGSSDITAGYGAQKDFASMLKSYQEGGNQATQGDIDTANRYGKQLFGAQQEGLNQSFEQARQQYAQQAAIQGRNPLDAVFANKQYTEQQGAQSMLNARQGAFSMDYAMQQPGQRLGFAAQRTNLLSGLATQAMQNRQALISLGSGVLTNERAHQYSTSTKFGNQESGGGLRGAILGGMAGFGMAADIGSNFLSAAQGGGGGQGGSGKDIGRSSNPSGGQGGVAPGGGGGYSGGGYSGGYNEAQGNYGRPQRTGYGSDY